MDVRFNRAVIYPALLLAGCGTLEVPMAETRGCILEPELLQQCEPPSLPTVQTFEQIDVAVTGAYVCTNQLNAQLAEILRRCSGAGPEMYQALVVIAPGPSAEHEVGSHKVGSTRGFSSSP